MSYALFALYGVSVLLAPWWVPVSLMAFVVFLPYGSLVAIFGALVLDATYGAPLQLLFGVSYLYTGAAVVLASIAAALSDRLLM